ncbi:hydroxylase [Pilimelia terevasa]|uniref:Hydroxylase n=1 Tax=Pilimelia terevasa TaxID=53372 RepID=A0A8J3BQK8_9ACTN|nr:VOC family protein [Pilimelia terevasa]GGK43149.1 hydroxylase [Pilimelia terevasa]
MTDFAPGTPCWLDLGTTDVAAATTFYGDLLGWTAEDLGPEANGYRLLRKDGRQVAGLGPATDPARGTSWAVHFATADLDESVALVRKHGGTVALEPMAVMDKGRLAVAQDPAGAYFSLWQAGTHPGAELVRAPGALHWVELFSTDRDGVTDFYRAVLGATTRDVALPGGLVYRLFDVGDEAVAGSLQITPEMGDMSSAWSVFFHVEDVDAVADAVVARGGRQIMRGDVPAGRMAMLLDPQDGFFSVMTPDPSFEM